MYRMFPKCPFGTLCRYVHPPCKYGSQCLRPNCAYGHSAEAFVDCKLGFSCPRKKPDSEDPCPFRHPQELCMFRTSCKNPSIIFSFYFKFF